MFDLPLFLKKKGSSMNTIWIFANSTRAEAKKRVSIEDVKSITISGAVTSLIDALPLPGAQLKQIPTRMSLALTARMLVGLARLYNYQVVLLKVDIERALERVLSPMDVLSSEDELESGRNASRMSPEQPTEGFEAPALGDFPDIPPPSPGPQPEAIGEAEEGGVVSVARLRRRKAQRPIVDEFDDVVAAPKRPRRNLRTRSGPAFVVPAAQITMQEDAPPLVGELENQLEMVDDLEPYNPEMFADLENVPVQISDNVAIVLETADNEPRDLISEPIPPPADEFPPTEDFPPTVEDVSQQLEVPSAEQVAEAVQEVVPTGHITITERGTIPISMAFAESGFVSGFQDESSRRVSSMRTRSVNLSTTSNSGVERARRAHSVMSSPRFGPMEQVSNVPLEESPYRELFSRNGTPMQIITFRDKLELTKLRFASMPPVELRPSPEAPMEHQFVEQADVSADAVREQCLMSQSLPQVDEDGFAIPCLISKRRMAKPRRGNITLRRPRLDTLMRTNRRNRHERECRKQEEVVKSYLTERLRSGGAPEAAEPEVREPEVHLHEELPPLVGSIEEEADEFQAPPAAVERAASVGAEQIHFAEASMPEHVPQRSPTPYFEPSELPQASEESAFPANEVVPADDVAPIGASTDFPSPPVQGVEVVSDTFSVNITDKTFLNYLIYLAWKRKNPVFEFKQLCRNWSKAMTAVNFYNLTLLAQARHVFVCQSKERGILFALNVDDGFLDRCAAVFQVQ